MDEQACPSSLVPESGEVVLAYDRRVDQSDNDIVAIRVPDSTSLCPFKAQEELAR